MRNDPIVDEIRNVREAHAERFNYDLEAIYHDLKTQEQKSRQSFVSYPPRRVQHVEKAGTTPKA